MLRSEGFFINLGSACLNTYIFGQIFLKGLG